VSPNKPPYGNSAAASYELGLHIPLTGAAKVAVELPFFEDHLIIGLCYVWQIEVWLCDQ
jgi:hypothetical protein